MKNLFIIAVLATVMVACNPSSTKTSFVTQLGNDTLAVEFFEVTGNELNAKVVLRSPSTTLSSYRLVMDETGGIQQMRTMRHDPAQGFETSGVVVQLIERKGDSLAIQMESPRGLQRMMVAYKEGLLPFIDMVHWPFDLALKSAYATGQDTVHQMLLSGRRISDFIIARMSDNSMTVRHPTRGVMSVDVNGEGELELLDAAQTTRKLKVYRHGDLDINTIANRFAIKDAQGSPFGALSSAEEGDFVVHGAEIHVEYGSPKKRGRTIFGGIVSYGTRWRTGANRATHLSTTRDLKIGNLTVPAGEYTLFSIPEEMGGTLIINKQTGQNGQSYDEAQDLGRVEMTRTEQDEVMEGFTITAEEQEGRKGQLKLMWDQTVYYVDFEVL